MSNIIRCSLLSLLVSVLAPGAAGAQDLSLELALDRLEPAVRAEARAELAGIDHQASLATAGYATSVAVHIAGLGMMVGGAFGGFCFNLGFGGGGSGCPDRTGWNVLAGIGVGTAVVGLVGLFVSIGLDVGSGRRRNAWRARYGVSDLDLALSPSHEGASFALTGRF